MAEKKIKTRIQSKHDLEVNWITAGNNGFIPYVGEFIVYDTEVDSDDNTLALPDDRTEPYTHERFKIGDGINTVNDLPFINKNHVVDVIALPESDIDQDATYRLLTGTFVLEGMMRNDSTCYVVEWDAVPETAGESVFVNNNGVFSYNGYYNKTDNTAYGYFGADTIQGLKDWVDNYSGFSTIIKGLVKAALEAMTPGWKTLAELEKDFSSSIGFKWGGFINNPKEATAEKTLYLLLRGEMLFREGGAWVGDANTIGVMGDGAGAEVFNSIDNTASGVASHAEGRKTAATGENSHTEGYETTAGGKQSHAEGEKTVASDTASHAEGYETAASGIASHAEGAKTKADGPHAHAEGYNAQATQSAAHAEGLNTVASAEGAHAEGGAATASGLYSHAEGNNTQATSEGAHAEGVASNAKGYASHAEGYATIATGENSHAEGNDTKANGVHSHTEGFSTSTSPAATAAHAEGYLTTANKQFSHAEGQETTADGDASHAEGFKTKTANIAAHAEGTLSEATGAHAHAEGYNTKATESATHAEGVNTTASGIYAHAEGNETKATGEGAHSEGKLTTASGNYSHASGISTTASGEAQTVIGKYNIQDSEAAFIIGNGRMRAVGTGINATTALVHSNAMTVDWDGNVVLGGSILAGEGIVPSERNHTIIGEYNKEAPNAIFIVGNGYTWNGVDGLPRGVHSNAHTLDWSGNAWYSGNIKISGTGYDDETAKTVATQEFVTDILTKLCNKLAEKNIEISIDELLQ